MLLHVSEAKARELRVCGHPDDAGAVRAVAVIPAYRPDEGLRGIVTDLVAAGIRVVVVDDGSGAQAAPIFESLTGNALVLRHPQNRGKGEALRTGLAWAREHFPGQTIVVTLDADGQHRVADVLRVCDVAAEMPDACPSVVLGARVDDKSTPLQSRVGHGITRAAFWLATRKRLTDTQTGLRAFRADIIPFLLEVPGRRYEYEMNMLLGLARDGVRVDEVVIETVYDAQTASHYRGIVDSLRIGRDLLAFSVSSFVSFLLHYPKRGGRG